jgi:ferredoxin
MSESSASRILHVDVDKCCGYGMCAELSPDVFSLDANGFVVASMTEIPEELMQATEDAMYSCPEKVLKLSTEHG